MEGIPGYIHQEGYMGGIPGYIHPMYYPVYPTWYIPPCTTLGTPLYLRTWTGVHCIHSDVRVCSDEALGSRKRKPVGMRRREPPFPLMC